MSKTKDDERGRKCFIITPIGDITSDTFRKAKGVIESVIKPVLQKYGFVDISPAYEILESGMIGNQIINRIVNDDLVVTNLTGNNPNVMYELAVRHAIAKPIIHICEEGTLLPFDIKDSRTIFYRDDMLGTKELQKDFDSYVSNIDYLKEYVDNPIYSGIKMGLILQKMNDDGRQTEAELLQKILDIVSAGTKTQSSKTRRVYANGNDFKMVKDADYIIRVNACAMAKYLDFLAKLRKEMSNIGVLVLGVNSSDILLNCQNKVSEDLLREKIRSIANETGIRITMLHNPDIVPSFEEMLQESLRQDKAK